MGIGIEDCSPGMPQLASAERVWADFLTSIITSIVVGRSWWANYLALLGINGISEIFMQESKKIQARILQIAISEEVSY